MSDVAATGQETESRAPRVFVSYSHDNERHRRRVLKLTTLLRGFGVDARIDRFFETPPPRSWAAWMHREIESADFVLVVCTETYTRRATGAEAPGGGLGARWEGGILTQETYEREDDRFIPVLLEHADRTHIPYFLRGTTFYTVDIESRDGIEPLLRHLFNEPEVVPAPLGTRPVFPLRDPSRAASEESEGEVAAVRPGDIIRAADAVLVASADIRNGRPLDVALLGLRQALEYFAGAMSQRVGAPCRATVKGVYEGITKRESGEYSEPWVQTIATSSSSAVPRRIGSSALLDNLDFATSLDRGVSIVFDSDSQHLASYVNRAYVPVRHGASIIWPLSLVRPGMPPFLAGFLCLDSSTAGAFSPERDIDIGYLFASVVTGFLFEAFASRDVAGNQPPDDRSNGED